MKIEIGKQYWGALRKGAPATKRLVERIGPDPKSLQLYVSWKLTSHVRNGRVLRNGSCSLEAFERWVAAGAWT